MDMVMSLHVPSVVTCRKDNLKKMKNVQDLLRWQVHSSGCLIAVVVYITAKEPISAVNRCDSITS